MKVRMAVAALAIAAGMVSSAEASIDMKRYMGSACSFADNPLAGHNKIDHSLKNTSGAQQWVTCPAVRDGNGSFSLSYLEYTGFGVNTRLEMKSSNGGAVVGWDRDREVFFGSGANHRSEWFVTGSGGASTDVGVALEILLNNNQTIFLYAVGETDVAI